MKKCNCTEGGIVLKTVTAVDRYPDHVRLTPEAARIMSRLRRLTGLSATQVVSSILIQAEDLIEIEEGEE